MRNVKRSILIVALLCAQSTVVEADCLPCSNPKSHLSPRSQGRDEARFQVGTESYINHYNDRDSVYGIFTLAPAYQRSFRGDDLTDYFFGQAATDGSVVFSGSRSANRGQFDILADYFGMPQDFKSTVCFNPRIENIMIDFDFYLGLDKWSQGMFIRLHAPFVHSRWSMNPHETVIDSGTLAFPNGYMSQLAIPRSELPLGVLTAFAGKATWGDMQNPLQFGKICPGTVVEDALADLQAYLGWNFVYTEQAHAGFSLLAIFPTGNKSTGEYLFEPIVGNGGFFEFGLAFTGHLELWHHHEKDRSLSLYLDANGTHMFTSTQRRSFDFIENDSLSRYILAAEYSFIPFGLDELPAVGHSDNIGQFLEYNSNLIPGINLTTICASVDVQLQGEFALKFAYKHEDAELDLGYSFWGKTAENVVPFGFIEEDTYALKGDAFLWGAADLGTSVAPTGAALAQAAYPANAIRLVGVEQDKVTVYTGQNFTSNSTDPVELQKSELNFGVDSPEAATARTTTLNSDVPVYSPIAGAGTLTDTQIYTSMIKDFINEPGTCAEPDGSNVDPSSAATPSAMTHKFYAHINYQWTEGYDDAFPYLGFGAEVEVDGTNEDIDFGPCNCPSAISLWGVWLKGGITF